MIGKQLAHYNIESPLGSGGMGEVYQARDTRLGRIVAVKVLPEAFAKDPERIARFEREAFERKHFFVMELVEGETLAERVRRGPIAAEEVLRQVGTYRIHRH